MFSMQYKKMLYKFENFIKIYIVVYYKSIYYHYNIQYVYKNYKNYKNYYKTKNFNLHLKNITTEIYKYN
jgi:hypothetical protein